MCPWGKCPGGTCPGGFCPVTGRVPCLKGQIGNQSSAAVTRPNPAGTRNENQPLGTPQQKIAQRSGQDLSG